MFKAIGEQTKENVKINKINSNNLKKFFNNLRTDFKTITWPDKIRVKKEFIIVLISSIIISIVLFGINFGTTYLFKLFF